MMRKVFYITIIILIIISSIFFINWNKLFPYKGEYISSKGVYHKTNCELLKYSSDKELIFYPNYTEAIIANNRPCKACKPQWFSDEEYKQYKKTKEGLEAKIKEEKRIEELVQSRLEERKLAILNGQKKDLTATEKHWKEEALEQALNDKISRNPKVQQALDEIIGNYRNQKRSKFFFPFGSYIDGDLQKQIEEEIKKEFRTK